MLDYGYVLKYINIHHKSKENYYWYDHSSKIFTWLTQKLITMWIGLSWQGFGRGRDCRGGICEKLLEVPPMSDGENAHWLQDRPTTGQGWALQKCWQANRVKQRKKACWTAKAREKRSENKWETQPPTTTSVEKEVLKYQSINSPTAHGAAHGEAAVPLQPQRSQECRDPPGAHGQPHTRTGGCPKQAVYPHGKSTVDQAPGSTCHSAGQRRWEWRKAEEKVNKVQKEGMGGATCSHVLLFSFIHHYTTLIWLGIN